MTGNITNESSFIAKAFDDLPLAVLIVDDDVRILKLNSEARKLVPQGGDPEMKRGGEFLRCVNSFEKGCGKGEFCKDCAVRSSVNEVLKKNRTVPFKKTHMKLERDGRNVLANLLLTASPVDYGGNRFVTLLIQDINELIKLSRLLPVCSNCKKIRDDKGSWESMEKYFEDRVDVDFSHGMCPECMKRLYGMDAKE